MGVGAVDKISNFYEFNVELGGPIVRDKLWFFGAYRKARYDKPIGNTFELPSGVPAPVGFEQCRSGAISCEQGISPEKMDNPILRLTWQASQRNKFAVYYDRALRLRSAAMGANTDPATASVLWNTPTFATGSAKWTSTLSSSLLLETGFSFNRERYDNLYQQGILAERNTAEWYRNVRKNDLSTGFLWNASGAQLGNYPDRYTVSTALSYVTGAHNVKIGTLYGWGPYRRYNNANADLYQTYNNGVPLRVTVLNTPSRCRRTWTGSSPPTSRYSIKRQYNGFELGFNARLPRGARVFGGFNLERTLADTCSAGTDPNFTNNCNQWDNGIPWQKQFKLAFTYPLPFWGITASAALQSLNGYVVGTAAIPYGVFTFGTGFEQPQGQGTFWQLSRTTRYAPDCIGPCRPGELVIPGLNTATLNVPLAAPETEYMPRINQLDLSVSKVFTVRSIRILPKVDVFNATNSDRWSSIATAQFGAASYLRPATILQGRLIRVAIESSW